jgi:hypothetical protein
VAIGSFAAEAIIGLMSEGTSERKPLPGFSSFASRGAVVAL